MDEESRREMQIQLARAKRQLDESVDGYLQKQAANIGVTQAVKAEAQAWDGYVRSIIASSKGDWDPVRAAELADKLLDERRKRFSVEALKTRMEQATNPNAPSPLCCMPTYGADGRAALCSKPYGHEGSC